MEKQSHPLEAALKEIINAKRLYRDRARDFVLDHPQYIPLLIQHLCDPDSELHVRAAWVTELVYLKRPDFIEPSLNSIIPVLASLSNESVLRPVAKIFAIYTSGMQSAGSPPLFDKASEELLIEACFDWLIQEHKIATKVFAMDVLLFYSTSYAWIKEALISILEKDTDSSSSGYRAHSRKILKKLS